MSGKIILVANTEWYLYNFRFSLARMLRDRGWDIILASPPGPFAAEFQKSGFRWISFSMSRRRLNPYDEFRTILELTTLYRRERPMLIHQHTIKPLLYGTLAARLSKVSAIVNSVTGLGYLFLSRRFGARVLRIPTTPIIRLALADDRVHTIFENSADRAFYIDRGMADPSRSTLIEGVGVDLEQFRPTPEAQGELLVIMASRMLWDKGVQEFVEAATSLRSKGLAARFALVGAPDIGNPASVPLHQMENWAKDGYVEWWGYRHDMHNVYRAAHIVALPSHFEGIPTVLLEGAASARPIVATNIPGNREVVVDRKTGILVPVGDSGALASAIEELIRDDSMRKMMGLEGRKIAEQRFGQDDINDQTVEVYNKLLAAIA